MSDSRGRFVVRDEDGNYFSTATKLADASPFYMKPTALGEYLIYGDDGSFLSVAAGLIKSTASPSQTANWIISGVGNSLTVVSEFAAEMGLGVNPSTSRVELAESTGVTSFKFAETTGCANFPELSTNASGTTYKGSGVDAPVIGFADVHSHISSTTFLGGAHAGRPFHPFGVTEAMGSCESEHGQQGSLDLVGNLLGPSGVPLGVHETTGWPTFVDWPKRDALTHEAMYYKWIERAWLAGLRVLVNDLVENEVLCTLQSEAAIASQSGFNLADVIGDAASLVAPEKCNEMESAVSQIQFMNDMQDYIDAQEGGPGKGWFRIVDSPAAAREVINDGKLAVVLGIEISHLFNCDVTQPGGLTDINGCDEAEIATQMDRLYDLGVREMFPIHEFDNAFGGNGIFDGLVLNVGNFVDTGKFWQTYDCPEQPYFFEAGAIMTSIDPSGGGNPVSDLITELTQGILPVYPTDKRQCNARGLTQLGEFMFQRMMDKKLIIEIDHLELSIKDDVLAMAEAETPKYPVVSTHGGHGGISIEQAKRILNVGGILYPAKGNGKQFVADQDRLRPLKSSEFDFAMGYGADTNGLAVQSGPRGSDSVNVSYPFTLFTGEGWGSQFADIPALTFQQSVVPEGNRKFDINAEGLAHYGMIADWVEAVRLEGGEQAITDLYNSAEVYLQMWERTINR
ncbi:peptidase M19 [Zhongshania sp. BJYM1]|uniref:peptidase M19 n=1 Tax=Zhongshania aquatica TaxID=2965069 RepID=UPI0022B5C30F|nr:peptidase M19 [Marortus sp. BJYM1]